MAHMTIKERMRLVMKKCKCSIMIELVLILVFGVNNCYSEDTKLNSFQNVRQSFSQAELYCLAIRMADSLQMYCDIKSNNREFQRFYDVLDLNFERSYCLHQPTKDLCFLEECINVGGGAEIILRTSPFPLSAILKRLSYCSNQEDRNKSNRYVSLLLDNKLYNIEIEHIFTAQENLPIASCEVWLYSPAPSNTSERLCEKKIKISFFDMMSDDIRFSEYFATRESGSVLCNEKQNDLESLLNDFYMTENCITNDNTPESKTHYIATAFATALMNQTNMKKTWYETIDAFKNVFPIKLLYNSIPKADNNEEKYTSLTIDFDNCARITLDYSSNTDVSVTDNIELGTDGKPTIESIINNAGEWNLIRCSLELVCSTQRNNTNISKKTYLVNNEPYGGFLLKWSTNTDDLGDHYFVSYDSNGEVLFRLGPMTDDDFSDEELLKWLYDGDLL